jgi:small GTP-binding protein
MVAISVLLWLARPRDEILLPAVLHIADLRRRVSRRFTIGVVGPPSSGKDAALGALFGIQTGNVHPVAGSTREVTVYRIAGDTGLQVVNTPGVGDVIEALTEEARAVLDQIDVFLFLVNAQGGVRTRERNEFALCRARRRPLLVVVNKIDTLKAEDRERFLEDTRLKLAQPAGGVMAAAFDPLPALSPIPLGLDPIKAWLRERLVEMGRDPAWIP